MDGPFTRYCAAACAQVRFRPDQGAILSERRGGYGPPAIL